MHSFTQAGFAWRTPTRSQSLKALLKRRRRHGSDELFMRIDRWHRSAAEGSPVVVPVDVDKQSGTCINWDINSNAIGWTTVVHLRACTQVVA